MTDTTGDECVSHVQNHWWWRPGWRQGRHFYAYHFTFEGSSELHGLVERYQNKIRHLTIFDLIPQQWLHLTMCGVGFVDEVTPDELAAINATVEQLAARTPPINVTFSHAVVRPEAVYLPAQPTDRLVTLHSAVLMAIRETLGDSRIHQLPEQAAGYRPHVSVAYANSNGTAQPIHDALGATTLGSADVTLNELPLLEFDRDNGMYQWTARTPLALRGERR